MVIAPNCQKQFARDQDWIRILKEKRAEYFELKTKHFIKPPDDDQNDPLLASQNSEWNQFFKDQDLRQQIKTDTNRAFQELDFFHMPENLQTLEDILFLFCRTHPNYGYPQGLHELAAFILYTFHEEMIADKDDTISFIFNANSVVPDTYFTFEKLAEYLEPFYSDVQDLSEEVQNVIIARKSPQLAKSLQMSGIAPHTYMMKWMRLLFLSVFDFDSVRPMWDVIIDHLPNLKVIKNACAAMLLNAGKKLINGDSTEALQLLFHYPAVPKPARFVVEGVEMTNKDGKGKMSREDLIMVVAERLNELSRGLNDICTLNGYELALPYVMDLRRTRDILIGILPVEEMLPLEMAVELFTPQKVEYTPVNEGNTGMNANSLHDKNEKTDFEFIKASSKSSSSKDNNNSSTTTTTVNQNVLFGGDEETVNDKANALFSDEPKPQSAADQKLFSGSKGVKSKQKRDGLASIVKQGSTQELFGDLEKPKSLSQADKTLFEIVQQPPSTNSQSVKVLEKASDPDFLNKQTVIQKVTPKRAESSSMSAGSQEKVLDDPLMSFKKEETNEKRSLFDTNSNQNEQKEKNKSQLLQNTDLFGNPTNSNSSSTNSKGGSLFDDESKKLENDPLFTAKASKKPKSGGTDDLLFGKKSQSKDAGSLFADDGKEANKKPRNNSKKSMPKASPFESNTTLDDNDPLFGGSTSTSSNGNNSTAGKKAKVIINKQALKKNTNLDKEKEEEILPKPKQKSIKPSIYDDDDEIQNAIIKKPNTTEKKGGLLDDDDDFLSGVSKPKQADKPKPKGGLFD
ncbi:hypothetical protein TRFO_38856 [Tritrichomonas foetus]|uniref:Rab-GAP TBC domain-containing protein n=1 Tax=Tritrichomonas foetus TaxID=1144522 RepID=A0A1J4J9S0_9EUKA|nr:hypothetical protein TRFO_38856 [Tritrichomonas foetus]|eukprot:OHS94967.1 hypothetical protein TRFO_38856 [Tritrichomonas foetus]